jgi:hypothetical protein
LTARRHPSHIQREHDPICHAPALSDKHLFCAGSEATVGLPGVSCLSPPWARL